MTPNDDHTKQNSKSITQRFNWRAPRRLSKVTEFEAKWDDAYPPISQSWRNNWARVIPFFDYPPEIRRIIYTTNAIESVNMSLRKVTKSRGAFPNDEAVMKLFYLALMNISKRWTMPLRDWKPALSRFSIQFEERMPQQWWTDVYTKFRTRPGKKVSCKMQKAICA